MNQHLNLLLMDTSVTSLLWPGLLAAIGYIGKSFVDSLLAIRTRRLSNIEDKLKLFYWPILLRMEQGNAIWESILSKRKDEASIEYRIGEAVEKVVLKQHQEILTTLEAYTYLAEPDEELTAAIKQYTKNVTLYMAIREAGEQSKFPTDIDPSAAYPRHFYDLIKKGTEYYQQKLNSRSLKSAVLVSVTKENAALGSSIPLLEAGD